MVVCRRPVGQIALKRHLSIFHRQKTKYSVEFLQKNSVPLDRWLGDRVITANSSQIGLNGHQGEIVGWSRKHWEFKVKFDTSSKYPNEMIYWPPQFLVKINSKKGRTLLNLHDRISPSRVDHYRGPKRRMFDYGKNLSQNTWKI